MRWLFRSICSVVLVCGCAHADPPAQPPPSVFGVWKLDPVLTKRAPDAAANGAAAASTPGRHGSGGGMGGARGGGAAGGGMGGGGHGGGGRHGGGHRSDPDSAKSAGAAFDAEQRDPGLERAFATQVTITSLTQRIRFDDGERVVELDRDGTNITGPNVGGTIALGASTPDIVIDTLTDSGYTLRERYHLGDDGRHLEMHVSLKKPGAEQTEEFVRVFDRVAPATPASAAVPVQ